MDDQLKGEIAEIKGKLEGVEGWFGDTEAIFLYKHARKISGRGVIVEIGSWKGRSTIWLAHAARKAGTKIYAIDPHIGSSEHQERMGKVDTYAEFLENIKRAGVDDVVIPIRKPSAEVAKEWDGKKIEFLWIDGAHEYEMVKLDYDSWSPFVLEGGTIAFHDTDILREGPSTYVHKYIYRSDKFKDVHFHETITLGTNTEKAGLFSKLRNRWMLLFKICYQTLRHSKIPRPKSVARLVSKTVNKVS